MAANLRRDPVVAGVTIAFVAGIAPPALGIMTNQPDAGGITDYFHQEMGAEYDAVVKQFAFETALEIESEEIAGVTVLTDINVVINQTFSSFASATLIAPQYVLTAAHTVRDYGWFQYEIGGEIYRAEQWWVPFGYETDELIFGQDIAVVRLDREVDTIAPMNWIRDQGKNLDGAEFTMVGLGSSNVDGGGATFIGGIRRAATNVFDADIFSAGYLDQDLNLNYDLDYPFGTIGVEFDDADDYPLTFEGMVLPGDSGGPDIVDGEIVGVHSYIYPSPDPLDNKLHGASTDVRRFSTWIEAIVENQNITTGPSAFGYEFGLAGITVQDIIDDLQEENPVLVPWLIANNYYNPATGMGATPFLPGFDFDTGLSPDDLAALSISLWDLMTAEELIAYLSANADDIDAVAAALDVAFRDSDTAALAAAMRDAFVSEFGPDALSVGNLNTIYNPNMFGENGTYPGGYQQGVSLIPEPVSLALLMPAVGAAMMRRRRA